MTGKSNTVTEIPHSALKELRDLYLNNWPQNCVGYYTLDNFIRWLNIDPHIKSVFMLCLNNDWSDGTFLVVNRHQLFLNTLNSSHERLIIALSLFDWSRGYKVSFLERHRPAVLSAVNAKELNTQSDDSTLLYHMSRNEASQIEINCPEDMIIKPMNEEHAVVANSVWPFRHKGSLFFLKQLVRLNPNLGVFKKDTDELVAWCFRTQGGFLGALQVKESYQRKGLGALVLRAMSRKLAETGHDVTACVHEDNIPSRNLFERHGFKIIGTQFWLRTKSTVDFTWTDD